MIKKYRYINRLDKALQNLSKQQDQAKVIKTCEALFYFEQSDNVYPVKTWGWLPNCSLTWSKYDNASST